MSEQQYTKKNLGDVSSLSSVDPLRPTAVAQAGSRNTPPSPSRAAPPNLLRNKNNLASPLHHRLPFSGGAFDLVFSDDPSAISGALFPSRLAAEAERAVRGGGGIALALDRQIETAAVAALFKRSRIVDVKDGTQVRLLILQSNGTTSIPH